MNRLPGLGAVLWACGVVVHVYLIAYAPRTGDRLRMKLGWIAAMLAASVVGLLGAFVVA